MLLVSAGWGSIQQIRVSRLENVVSTNCFAVDIGNSGARVLPFGDGTFAGSSEPWRVSWGHDLPGNYRPENPDWARELFRMIQSDASQLTPTSQPATAGHWWIASVNRPATSVLLDFLRSSPHCHAHPIAYSMVPMALAVDHPDRLGIDRLLAAWAACQKHPGQPLIVIQAGSAVTVDWVEPIAPELQTSARHAPASPAISFQACSQFKTARFCGGAILPGVPMMLRLLGQAADMLPSMAADDLVNLPPLPGKNTEAAMLAGCSSSLVGGVQHLVARYRSGTNRSVPVIISGGDGPLLAPFLEPPVLVEHQLVMQGIQWVAQAAGGDLDATAPAKRSAF